MSFFSHLPASRPGFRAATKARIEFAATDAQAARLAALRIPPARRSPAPALHWDATLLDRLTTPVSRVRE